MLELTNFVSNYFKLILNTRIHGRSQGFIGGGGPAGAINLSKKIFCNNFKSIKHL